jgi:hypothetical protein
LRFHCHREEANREGSIAKAPGKGRLPMPTRPLFFCALVLLGVGPASALPLSTLENSYAFMAKTAAICMRRMPTEANPIRDASLFDQLRQDGWLVDSFKCGRCSYYLTGDPDTAFYLRSCR